MAFGEYKVTHKTGLSKYYPREKLDIKDYDYYCFLSSTVVFLFYGNF
jgi:hypothetical protein